MKNGKKCVYPSSDQRVFGSEFIIWNFPELHGISLFKHIFFVSGKVSDELNRNKKPIRDFPKEGWGRASPRDHP